MAKCRIINVLLCSILLWGASPLLANEDGGGVQWHRLTEAGRTKMLKGDLPEAEKSFEEALKLSESFTPLDTRRIVSLSNMSLLLKDKQQLDLAEQYSRKALALIREDGIKDGAMFGVELSNLAGILADQAKFEEAMQLYESAMLILSKARGEDSLEVATVPIIMLCSTKSSDNMIKLLSLKKNQ
ncbi:MAG: tetratricopeptide repeat protein [Candidatus Obscuribacter sp.]|nr:tetratricopeptide repeat protein [Candidatus Obscuribacter sp.]